MAVVRTENLSVGYGGRPVLEGVGLSVEAGEILALLGPNGAGKTTLLKTLVRELPPLAGHVFLDGRPLAALTGEELARTAAIVLTTPLEAEGMTCREAAASGRYPYTGRLGVLSAADRARTAEAMELLEVADLADRPFREISDGQRQRVMLARAVCQEPKLLALDEPAAFLDIRRQLELADLLRRLAAERHLAVVLSLHEVELARRVADTVYPVRPGGGGTAGPPAAVLSDPAVESLYGLPPGGYRAYRTGMPAGRETPPGYAFFQNRACEMFPCHAGVPPEAFNCLFCYCPLYALGERCGGNFTWTDRGVKSCAACDFPHRREHYGAVLARFPELAALAAGQNAPSRNGDSGAGRETEGTP